MPHYHTSLTPKAFFLFILLPFFSGPLYSFAQTHELEPARWFPLELGSYWHYEYEDNIWRWNVVKTADRDTIIDDNRWVGITMIHCDFTPHCRQKGTTEYFRFTGDNYLLSSARDTVDAMYPRSLFTVSEPMDTLYSSMEQEFVGLAMGPLTNLGESSDTTDLVLVVAWPFPYDHSAYRYNIGDTYKLSAARVAGKEVGDTSFIDRVISEQSVATQDTLDWTGYYPLEIGNFWRWSYQTVAGIFQRESRIITGDTLINGTTYFKQRALFFEEDAQVQEYRDSTWMEYVRYDSLNTRIVAWSVEKQQDIGYTCNLNAAFDATTECEELGGVSVDGGYAALSDKLLVTEDSVSYSAAKRFANEDGGYTYYHGIGRIPYDPDSLGARTFFTHFLVNGVEYGENRIPVFIDREPDGRLADYSVYPNPSRGRITIQGTPNDPMSILIYDALGRKVRAYPSCSFPCMVDLQGLPTGLYFIELKDNVTRKRVTKKVVVKY